MTMFIGDVRSRHSLTHSTRLNKANTKQTSASLQPTHIPRARRAAASCSLSSECRPQGTEVSQSRYERVTLNSGEFFSRDPSFFISSSITRITCRKKANNWGEKVKKGKRDGMRPGKVLCTRMDLNTRIACLVSKWKIIER